MVRSLIVFILFIPLSLSAQQDSTVVLDNVDVSHDRLERYAKGDHVDVIDAKILVTNQESTLAELLTKYGGINVRSYGYAGLATPSFRGTGSSQSTVFWEGFNLQSVMNGSADLSQIPVNFIDEASLQYGGSSALFGSGAMGGAIHLNGSRPKFGDTPMTTTVSTSLGSFGSYYLGANIGKTTDQSVFKLRTFYQSADNDYKYTYQGSEEKLENAATKKYGTMAEISWKIKRSQQLHVKYWFQNNYLEIPKTASKGLASTATQNDLSHRGMIKYERAGSKVYWSAKSGLFWHRLHYQSNTLDSKNPSLSSISEMVAEFSVADYWQMETAINHTFEYSNTTNYGANSPSRNRTALVVTNHLNIGKKVVLDIAARQMMYDGVLAPFTPSIGVKYEVTPHWSLRSKWARSFRVPTFNDLFWAGAGGLGNPDLVPENGNGVDVGASYVSQESSKLSFQFEVTLFYNHIKNWIQWRPSEESSIWTPINVDEIWSFGSEVRGKLGYQLSSAQKVSLNVSYNYVKSTIEPSASGFPISFAAMQNMYTPIHQGNATLSYQWKQFGVNYHHTYTGKQYTDQNNSERFALDAYQLGDLSIRYQFDFQDDQRLQTIFRINNISNQSYQNRRDYPMPGRNFKLSIIYKIN